MPASRFSMYGAQGSTFAGEPATGRSQSVCADLQELIELRSVDASGNPYPLLASIVAVAIEGVDNRMTLTASDSTALLGQNAKMVAVIPDELPRSFHEAFRCLEEQGTMGKFFGDDFIQAYRGVIEICNPPSWVWSNN